MGEEEACAQDDDRTQGKGLGVLRRNVVLAVLVILRLVTSDGK